MIRISKIGPCQKIFKELTIVVFIHYDDQEHILQQHQPFNQHITIIQYPNFEQNSCFLWRSGVYSQRLKMDEEEVEVWDQASRGCSHTHSCNPPDPEDGFHSHTCFHTHTHLIIPDQLENDHCDENNNKKRSCGNREAVRKYREKKKAHTAYLEDEVKRLQSLNEHLLRKLQSQAMVETELIRLRTLLVEMQGKIDGELSGFLFQKQCNGSGFLFKEDGCNVATRNVTCEAARVECDEAQTLHDDAIYSFVPDHSPPFSH